MSLVGPRAVVPYVVDQFQDWERISLAVRPGVTGLAQVSGRDAIGFREKSLLNLYYVRNYSFWLDLRIIFDTIGVVLTMEGTGGTRRD
jgi:lipopolysaccharide/colanic/teichoic acid biosynthesis glycosyltransferase